MSSGPKNSPTIMRRVIEMEELRSQGMTFAKIGQQFGLSRQAVHQLLTGKSGPKNEQWKLRNNWER